MGGTILYTDFDFPPSVHPELFSCNPFKIKQFLPLRDFSILQPSASPAAARWLHARCRNDVSAQTQQTDDSAEVLQLRADLHCS